MNLTGFEKTAGPIGSLLANAGKTTASIIRTVGKYPKSTIGLAAGLSGLSLVLNAANKARGFHQIVNESGKRDVMDYQTRLLREIAEGSRRQPAASPAPGFKPLVPIIPPLR